MARHGRRYASANFENDWGSRRSTRKQIGSRRSAPTKQQLAWEFASAQFESSFVKACCRQPSSYPRHHGKFRSRLSKARPSRQACGKLSDADPENIGFIKMIRL